jgi:hypothetical protein
MLRAIERVDDGTGIIRIQSVDFIPNSIGFGNTGGVPSGGTLGLLGPGNTSVGIRVPYDQRIMGVSLQVNVIDTARTFNLSIRVNGVEVSTLALALSTLGTQNVALNIPVVTGDVITLFMVRTSGAQASTFTQIRAQLLTG